MAVGGGRRNTTVARSCWQPRVVPAGRNSHWGGSSADAGLSVSKTGKGIEKALGEQHEDNDVGE
jgi:hypothetical protein